jgi:hypothetical protein
MKIAVFWVAAPCSQVEVYQCFRGPTRIHGATTQKTAIFILTAVRTSNPTQFEDVIALMMEVVNTFEMSVSIYHTNTAQHPRRHNNLTNLIM